MKTNATAKLGVSEAGRADRPTDPKLLRLARGQLRQLMLW